jgi:hypothetical protein
MPAQVVQAATCELDAGIKMMEKAKRRTSFSAAARHTILSLRHKHIEEHRIW